MFNFFINQFLKIDMNRNSVYILFSEHGLNPAIPILSSVLGLTLIVLIIFFVRYFRQKTTSEGIM